jgi:hypothetical protein
METPRILVTVEHPGGTGGVVREGRQTFLADRVPQPVTRLDDHRPVVIGLGDRTLQGGLLPPGAVEAWVTDDRGERHRAQAGQGAWAIVLDHQVDGRPGPVCFRDAAGALLAPALPAAWARTPVLDADEPCPACDSARGWDEVIAGDASRGTQGFAQRQAPFVVCRACGHEHSIGVFYAGLAADEPDAKDLARMRRDAEERRRLAAQMALADLAFAVFVARGRSGRIAGWGSSNHVLTSVQVDHGAAVGEAGPRLRVTTERERHRYESEAALARSALRAVLEEVHLGAWPQRSSAGVAIWLDAVQREARRAAARSVIEERALLVDGAPIAVATVACGAHWSAAGRRDDLLLVLTARDVELEQVELVSATDPLAALAPM